MKTKTIKCNFKNSRGHTLAARLDIPAALDTNNVRATTFIIFCHCFTCTKETITTFRLSRLLAEHGYAVLRFDFTGLGDSEGNFSSTTFSSTQDDLDSAINFLTNHYREPAFLMGHSLGGTTVLSVAQKYKFIKGIVTVASPSDPEHVLHHFGHALTLLEQNIPASFEVAGQYFDLEPGFVEDVRKIDMQACLSSLEKPVLVFNIDNDALVNESNAQEIQQWANGDVTLVDVAGSNHLLTNKGAVEMVAEDIIDWMNSID
jgi:putative redox protein